MVCATSKASDQPAQSDQSLCLLVEYSMSVKLLTDQHLEFLRLKGGCTGWSESTRVKMPHCWKSRVMAHNYSFEISYTHNGLIRSNMVFYELQDNGVSMKHGTSICPLARE